MTGALVILGFLICVGVILYLHEMSYRRKSSSVENDTHTSADTPLSSDSSNESDTPAPETSGEVCCGLHLVCEKDSLSPMSDEILYYDDEELDRFLGRTPESYSPEETEEFREVLMTLRPEDVSGWARSITQRHLELPPEIRDELFLLINEQRGVR